LKEFGNNGNIWAQAVCSKWSVFGFAHEVIRDLYRMFKTVKPEKWLEMLHMWGRRGMHRWILKEILDFRYYLQDQGLDGKIIFKYI
jgi:hypothetical protein